MKKAMKEWKSFLHSPFYFNTLKKIFPENFTFSFHIFESRVIYIVEGHEKARGFDRNCSIDFQVGHRKWKYEAADIKKWYRLSVPTFPENG